MTVTVLTFPGSNCDRDCVRATSAVAEQIPSWKGTAAQLGWHKDARLPANTSAVILPGGFSYGDYLRAAAMASCAPIMSDVVRFAKEGGPVLGICNGFQMLCELGLLEGALMHNKGGLFVCCTVELEVTGAGDGLLAGYVPGERIQMPVAHGEGSYHADERTLDRLEGEGRIAFRYTDLDEDGHGRLNGSRRGIAGIVGGPQRNIVGLMPHPERRAEARLGGKDGAPLLRQLLRGLAPDAGQVAGAGGAA